MAKPAGPPATRDLSRLKKAAKSCLICSFAVKSTQTVFGEGASRALLMLVGEQPGNSEDLEGRVFVGPAGRLLDEVLAAAGIARDQVYITNAVKHFKYIRRGKSRLHAKPNSIEIANCRPWLASEIAAVRPRVIVAMGATAVVSVLGRAVPIGRSRGQWFETRLGESRVLVTWHPSAILRAPEPASREEKKQQLTQDLARARKQLERT